MAQGNRSLTDSQARLVVRLLTRESDRLALLSQVDPTEFNLTRQLEVMVLLDSLTQSGVVDLTAEAREAQS